MSHPAREIYYSDWLAETRRKLGRKIDVLGSLVTAFLDKLYQEARARDWNITSDPIVR